MALTAKQSIEITKELKSIFDEPKIKPAGLNSAEQIVQGISCQVQTVTGLQLQRLCNIVQENQLASSFIMKRSGTGITMSFS